MNCRRAIAAVLCSTQMGLARGLEARQGSPRVTAQRSYNRGRRVRNAKPQPTGDLYLNHGTQAALRAHHCSPPCPNISLEGQPVQPFICGLIFNVFATEIDLIK